MGAFIQRVENLSDLRIDKADTTFIGSNQFLPINVAYLQYRIVIPNRNSSEGQGLANHGNIAHFIGWNEGTADAGHGIGFEPVISLRIIPAKRDILQGAVGYRRVAGRNGNEDIH